MVMKHRSESMTAGPMAVGLLIVATLAACAPAVVTEPVPGPVAENGNDCAVIAAVVREHYRFNATDNVPPPLRMQPDEAGWAPRCDWARYGLFFTAYDERPDGTGRVRPWLDFDRPRYDGQGAVITTGVMYGTRNGEGAECRVRSGFAGWTVSECRRTWAS